MTKLPSIKEQRELCEKATPGSWLAEVAQGDSIRRLEPHSCINLNTSCAWPVGPSSRTTLQAQIDANLIASMRTNYPALLDWAVRARRVLVGMETGEYMRGVWRELENLLAELPEE